MKNLVIFSVEELYDLIHDKPVTDEKSGTIYMSVTMLESQFQAKLIKELKKRFPGCIVMKSDSGYLQGIPDLLILYNDRGLHRS